MNSNFPNNYDDSDGIKGSFVSLVLMETFWNLIKLTEPIICGWKSNFYKQRKWKTYSSLNTVAKSKGVSNVSLSCGTDNYDKLNKFLRPNLVSYEKGFKDDIEKA